MLVGSAAAVVAVSALALAVLETRSGKNQLRMLIVQQANQYLTAHLEIAQLEGSLVSGVRLRNVRLSRDGRAVVSIERVSIEYSLREWLREGIAIQRLQLVRPIVSATRLPDGRWLSRRREAP